MANFDTGPRPDKNRPKVKAGLVRFIKSAITKNNEFAETGEDLDYSISALPVGQANDIEVRITHDKLAFKMRINGNQNSLGEITKLDKAIPIQGDIQEGDYRPALQKDYQTAIEIFNRVVSLIENR